MDIIYKTIRPTVDHYVFLKSHFMKLFKDEIDFMRRNKTMVVESRIHGILVGVSYFVKKSNSSVHLNASAVVETFRGKSINVSMKNEIVKWCKLNNYNNITCNVRDTNISSVKSLTKSGFKIDDSKTSKYKNGDTRLEMYLKIE